MKKYGQSWAMISSAMEGRTGKQIRDRYLNKLRPNIKCGDWSNEEDQRLIQLLNEVGNRWSLIATHLPGRTEGQVKNRYYSSIKKRLQSNGTLSQITPSRNTSANVSSYATSPEVEEIAEFESNGCVDFINQEPVFRNTNQGSNFVVAKGPYMVEEDTYSEQSTTEGFTSQRGSESPLRVIDPTSVISYNATEKLFFGRTQSYEPFLVPTIEHDNQIDDILGNVTTYFTDNTNASSDVDSYFADDLKSQNKNFSSFIVESNSNDRYEQLAQRKAYLELALARTLKEIKGL